MKKIGLTLGKFAPLHKGHQFMIEKALKEMDELYLLIYDTKVTKIPLSIRSNWIRKLYPSVKILEGWDGPDGYSNERSFEILQENYILKILNGVKITHFYSSEFYGGHVSKALNGVDMRVDEARKIVPISATNIRENAFKYRSFIDNIVYNDLISKIVFLGAPSTGKSTITEILAKKFKTEFVPEYGREYWEKNQINRRISLESFDKIAKGHIEIEDRKTLTANKYLFIDTNAITTYMFSLDYYGKTTKFLKECAKDNQSRYDLFFLCEDDIKYDDTWDRSGNQKRYIFHKQIISDLKERRIPYISLTGNLETRVSQVEKILKKFEKYNNFFGDGLI